MNQFDWLDAYLLAFPGAEKDFKAEWGWHRYMVRGKLFAAVCAPGPEHKPPYAGHELVNLKCDPRLAEGFRAEYPEVQPGFYCDKKNWNAVLLDGDLPGDVLKSMCEMSYRLIVAKLPKYVQREIQAQRGEN